MYAHGDSAQRVPRGFRLLLYGDTHVELDMTGAFYELTRRLAQSRLGRGGMLPPIAALRARLRQVFTQLVTRNQEDLETVVKKWPLFALNGSHQQLATWVYHKIGVELPYDLVELANHIRQLGSQLARHLGALVRDLDGQVHTTPFRVLEQFDDGVWVTPAPDLKLVHQIELKVYRKWQIDDLTPALTRTSPSPAPLLPYEWHKVEVTRRLIDAPDAALYRYLRKSDHK